MKYTKSILLSSFIVLGGAYTATAQNDSNKKNLTQEQLVYGIPTDIVKPMPTVIRWADKDNYIVMLPNRTSFEKVDVKSGKRVSIAADEAMPKKFENETNPLMDNRELINVTLSPNGAKAAYTKADNNLYSYDFATSKETQLTSDGTMVLMNGYASWVYYEEILGRPSKYKAFWWSPNSRLIAYYKFDDSRVPMFPIYNSKGKHGTLTETRYPKAGDPNPEVKIGFVGAEGERLYGLISMLRMTNILVSLSGMQRGAGLLFHGCQETRTILNCMPLTLQTAANLLSTMRSRKHG